jgi:hypothetical protein
MRHFHRYSISNLMLIMAQRPDATRVAGFHTWKKLGRTVNRGERGIRIFAPMVLKPRSERAADDADSNNADAPTRLGFRVVHVFDVAQTSGAPLPEPARVGGEPGAYLPRLESAIRQAGIQIDEEELRPGVDGASFGGRIVMRPGLAPAERSRCWCMSGRTNGCTKQYGRTIGRRNGCGRPRRKPWRLWRPRRSDWTPGQQRGTTSRCSPEIALRSKPR